MIEKTNFVMLDLQVTFQTELGQLIDLITAPEDHVDLSKFSLEKSVPSFVRFCDASRSSPLCS
jgi:hypothetical protein